MTLKYLEPLFKIVSKADGLRSYSGVVYLGQNEAVATDGYALLKASIPGLNEDKTVDKNNLPSNVKFPKYEAILNEFEKCTEELDMSLFAESLDCIGSAKYKKVLPFVFTVDKNKRLVIGQMEDYGFNPWIIKNFLGPVQKFLKTKQFTGKVSPCGQFLILETGNYTLYLLGVYVESKY
jgi:hypothetical protein